MAGFSLDTRAYGREISTIATINNHMPQRGEAPLISAAFKHTVSQLE